MFDKNHVEKHLRPWVNSSISYMKVADKTIGFHPALTDILSVTWDTSSISGKRSKIISRVESIQMREDQLKT